jgi:hypothetical protein
MSFHIGQTEETNMKGKRVKKLVLSRETVANLQEKDLKKVAGGVRSIPYRDCYSQELYPDDTWCLC